MAQQLINNGTVAGDGTGEILFTAFEKTNNNSTEMYGIGGWGNYDAGLTAPVSLTVNTTPSKFQSDALGSGSNSDYLPLQIRGISELWDAINDKITPIGVGDTYDVSINLEILTKIGAPKDLIVTPDIGGAAGITIPIPGAIVPVETSLVPFTLPIYFKVFSLATFLLNGAQIFLATDAGTITIGARSIFIERVNKGIL